MTDRNVYLYNFPLIIFPATFAFLLGVGALIALLYPVPDQRLDYPVQADQTIHICATHRGKLYGSVIHNEQ